MVDIGALVRKKEELATSLHQVVEDPQYLFESTTAGFIILPYMAYKAYAC